MTQLNLETAVPIATLDATINNSVTSLDVGTGEGATLPTVPFIIGINEEAMRVTNVATDTLTVVRGFGGTTATAHTAADEVKHIFTAEFFGLLPDHAGGLFYAQGDIDMNGHDLNTGETRYDLLHSAKATADTPDDEFNSTTLDAKWTTAGSAGTVTLFKDPVPTTEIYDLTSRPGWLMLQAGNADTINLSQTYTLPDSASMILPISASLVGHSGDNQACALRLTDGTAWINNMLEQDTSEWLIQGNTNTNTLGVEFNRDADTYTNIVNLRIARVGLTYHCLFSFDGFTWNQFFSQAFASALTSVEIMFLGASTGAFANVMAVPWIRQGTNNYDPWDISVQF